MHKEFEEWWNMGDEWTQGISAREIASVAWQDAQPKWLSTKDNPKEQQQINICLNSNTILFGRFILGEFCEYDSINDKFICLNPVDIRCWIPVKELPEKYDV